MGWLGISEINQSISYALDTSDWSDEYLRMEATIVDSEERKWGSEGPSSVGTAKRSKSPSYSCGYFLEISYNGARYRQKAVWISEMYETQRGRDCGAARYGETFPVWVAEGYKSDPRILKVGNRNSKPMMIGFKILIGVAALYGSFRLGRRVWHGWSRPDPAAWQAG